jgi:hypothetical protein
VPRRTIADAKVLLLPLSPRLQANIFAGKGRDDGQGAGRVEEDVRRCAAYISFSQKQKRMRPGSRDWLLCILSLDPSRTAQRSHSERPSTFCRACMPIANCIRRE